MFLTTLFILFFHSCFFYQKLAKASAIVGRFSSGMVGLIGGLVNEFMSLDCEDSSWMSRVLESQLKGLSSAAGNTAGKTASTRLASRSREVKDSGKQTVEGSDSDHEVDDGGGDGHSDEDLDFHVHYHHSSGGPNTHEASGSGGSAGPSAHVASGSGTANPDVDATMFATAIVSVRSAGIDGTTTAGTDQPLESQIMLTARSGNVSTDGLHNQPDMTDTQNEAIVDASVKRCGLLLSVTWKSNIPGVARNYAYLLRPWPLVQLILTSRRWMIHIVLSRQ